MAAAIETTRTASISISVDTSLCKGCEICVARCPTDVFEMRPSGSASVPEPTDAEACIDCGTCELLCPDFALEVETI